MRAQAQYKVFSDAAVERAFAFAYQAHAGQQRRNGEPVFMHCVETAKMLADLGLTADVVAAGLLHDTLDDTHMTEPRLRSNFAPAIVDMVCKVSRMSAICQLNRDQQAARPLDRAKLADTLMCMADPRCVLIKLADRLHNMRTIAALPEAKRQRMAQESMDIFSPLANRLGVWGLKAELEDLCFQQLYPAQHSQLHHRLQESQARGSIELALNKLKGHLDGIGMPHIPTSLDLPYRLVPYCTFISLCCCCLQTTSCCVCGLWHSQRLPSSFSIFISVFCASIKPTC